MQLATRPPGLETLRAYLAAESERPVAVAYSGGGDSHALLLAADHWSRAAGRRLVVLHIDHRLQARSGEWAARCRSVARRLGHPIEILPWTGDKPATGLPAAARRARHRFLADAARRAGAAVILTGHTADDLMESRQMRGAGSTVPDARIWSPSPAWPEGRDLFLLRPLLAQRRADLRAWLTEIGETWIDDPANEDLRYARARARAGLEASPDQVAPSPRPISDGDGLARFRQGWMSWPRDALLDLSEAQRRGLLGVGCLCIAGSVRPPRTEALDRILTLLPAAPRPQVASLAGARVCVEDDAVVVCREPGEARRGGLSTLLLPAGGPVVWDGRYEITADRPGLVVRPLKGVASGLSSRTAATLARIPPAVRWGLPAVVEGDRVTCPVLEDAPGIACRWLVPSRYRAATGGVENEVQALGLAQE